MPALRGPSPALVALVAATGCNAIFGLDPVAGRDAAPPPEVIAPGEAGLPAVQLTFMVAELEGGGPGAIRFPEIPDGVLEQLRAGTSSADLAPVERDARGVLVPEDLLAGAWRFEYKLARRPPVELQWTTTAGIGHVVEPVLGRLDRTPAPAGSSYALSATGAGTPATFGHARMLTLGVWMEQLELTGGPPLVVAMDATTSQSGDRAAPDPAAGDAIVLAEYDRANSTDGNLCDNTIGSASYEGGAIQPLAADTQTALTTTWEVATLVTPAVSYPQGDGVLRLRSALTDPDGKRDATVAGLVRIGALAHAGMPGFTRELDGVPAPVMLPWVECKQAAPTTTPDKFRPPVAAANLDRVAYVAVTDTRTRSNVKLVSSLVAATSGVRTATSFAIDFGVPLAKHPIALDTLALSGPTDDVELTPGSGEMTLTFDLDGQGTADYYEVTVFQLLGGLLVPLRVYVKADPSEPSVQIDRALFTSDHEYVLRIRCIRGRPLASAGDFAQVQAPQAVSTVFTRTLRVP